MLSKHTLLLLLALVLSVLASYPCNSDESPYSYSCVSSAVEELGLANGIEMMFDAGKVNDTTDIWPDLSGNNYHGDLGSSKRPDYGSQVGLSGSSTIYYFRFDGRKNYVPIRDKFYPSLTTTESVTIAIWFRTSYNDLSSGWATNWALFDYDRSENFNIYVTNSGFLLFSFSADDQRFVDIQEDSSSLTPLYDSSLETWHFVAATYTCNGGTDCYVDLYRDGYNSYTSDPLYEAIGYQTSSTRYGFIGDGSEANTFNGTRNEQYFEGDISFIAFWEESLTESQIQELYDATKDFYQVCDAGYYCEYGLNSYECPSGYFCPGDWQAHECGEGQTYPNSVYCPGGSSQTEPTNVTEGYYTTGNSSTLRTAQSICLSGYYCNKGEMLECGSPAVYCPLGSSEPVTVSEGYYSTGGSTNTTHSSQLPCSPGTYCVDGVQHNCPAGSYGSTSSLTSSNCTGECLAGYYCPAGSTSKTQTDCGDGMDYPANYYCPEGTEEVLEVEDGYYSTPEASSEYNREAQALCSSLYQCLNGTRELWVSWTNGSCASEEGWVSLTVEENSLTATAEKQVAVSRKPGDSVLYTLVPFSSNSNYTLSDSSVGLVSASRELDYESDSSEYAYLIATGDTSGIQINCTVKLAPSDANDRPTLYTNGFRNVSEDTPKDEPIGEPLYVEDDDVSQTLTFSIVSGNDDGFFSIGGCSGQLYLAQAGLDYNTQNVYYLGIQVTDDGSPSYYDNATLTMYVNDANDPPYFTQTNPTLNITENAPANARCNGTITYADEDVSDTITWSITRNDDDLFGIDEDTGEVYVLVGGTIDYEQLSTYNIEVTITDSEGATDSIDVDIEVLDVNEAPTFTYPSMSVSESASVGTTLSGTPVYYDEDGDTDIRFELWNSGSVPFSIDASSGELELTEEVNYEAVSNYSLQIAIYDQDNASSWDTVLVSVNDANDDPIAYGLACSVAENASTGYVMCSVDFSDEDADQTHTFSVVSISTLSGSNLDVSGGEFEFDDSLSQDLVVGEPLDYELVTSYRVKFKVKDSSKASDTAFANVTVIDSNDQPTIDQEIYVFVSENFVGNTTAKANGADEDDSSTPWGRFNYSLDGSVSSHFELVQYAGEDSAWLFTTEELDFETEPSWEVEVTVTDGGGSEQTGMIYVTVVDENDAPTVQSYYGLSVAESASSGAFIATIEGEDEDDSSTSWGKLKYSILENTPYFTIGSSSGKLYLSDDAQNMLGSGPFIFNVTVSDFGGLSANTTVNVTLEDVNFAPEFRNSSWVRVEVAEMSTSLDVVLVAYDKDEDDLRFSIVSCSYGTGDECSSSVLSKFSLSSGVDLGANYEKTHLSLLSSFDYEEVEGDLPIDLSIEVRDVVTSSLADLITIQVNVTDVAESPSFVGLSTKVFRISEDSSVGTSIVTLRDYVSDDDGSINSLVYFIQNCTNDVNPFDLTSRNGTMTVKSGLDYESYTQHYCSVNVTDTTGLTGYGKVKVKLQDVNEVPYIYANQTFYVWEDASVGSTVGSLEFEDQDAADSGTFSFTHSEDEDSPFTLSSSGVLSIAETLDYEQENWYLINVTVEDSGGLASTELILVIVQDVNDLQVTSITPSELNNEGWELIQMEGSNFGPDWLSNSQVTVTAWYANQYDGAVYEATNCLRHSTTNITCRSAVGVGIGHSWNVTVFTNSTTTWSTIADETTDYKTPVVSQVKSSSLSTQGGQQVTILGNWFGPVNGTDDVGGYEADFVRVTYGRSDDEVAEFDCTSSLVLVSNTKIVCTSQAGSGNDLFWRVSVGVVPHNKLWAGYSDVFASNVSYMKPEIHNVTSSSASVTNLKTIGGEVVTISGLYFGVSDTVNDLVVTYGGPNGDKYTMSDCSILVNHVKVVCETTEGVGANLTMKMYVDGLWSEATNTTVSYANPVIEPLTTAATSAVTGLGVTASSTEGGSRVIIAGSQFGPSDGESDPVVTYGVDGSGYIAEDCTVSVDHSQISCFTTEGTGSGYSVRVKVGGQWSNVYDAQLNYTAPTIYYYEPYWDNIQDSTGGNTEGKQTVLIHGSDFGPVSENAVNYVSYGYEGYDFKACDLDEDTPFCYCSVIEDHTTINCTSVEGAGAGLSFVIEVNGLKSTVPQISYGLPVIESINGTGSLDASPSGYENVTLWGSNFGPNQTYLESVTYGPGGSEYEAQDCVLVSHSQIDCLTARGVGGTLYWSLKVRGQESELSTQITNYQVPTVKYVTMKNSSTEGGSMAYIYGEALAVYVSAAYFQVLYDGSPIYVDGTETKKMSMLSSTYSGYDSERGLDYLAYVVPEFTSGIQRKNVSVLIAHSVYGSTSQVSDEWTFEYFDPVITQIQNIQLDTTSSITVSTIAIFGENFGGSEGEVYINGELITEVRSWDHNQIELDFDGTTGNATVLVGNRWSNTMEFYESSPLIITGYPAFTPEEDGYRTEAVYSSDESSQKAGTRYNITIAATQMGSLESAIEVTVGDFDCPIISGSLSEVSWLEFSDTVSKVSCYLPEGTGIENEVTLYVGGVENYKGSGVDEITVDYKAPTISSISPSYIQTTGGYVTLSGDNFGHLANRLSATYGSSWLTAVSGLANHTELVLMVPEGEGLAKDLWLDVDGQSVSVSSDSSSPEVFRFYGPEIRSVVPSSVATTGGLMNLTGSNFGRPGYASVSIEDSTGTKLDYEIDIVAQDATNHSWMVLRVGEGEGEGNIVLNVSNQFDEVAFAYDKPAIYSIYPNHSRTEGGELITITGSNFGVGDDYKVYFNGQDVESAGGSVVNITHTELVFTSLEGQSDDVFSVYVEISGVASNTTSFYYDPPVLYFLSTSSDDPQDVFNSSVCDRYSEDGCGLYTEGGYAVILNGDNFGTSDRYIYFDESEYSEASGYLNVLSHTQASFLMVGGVGTDIPMKLQVGSRSSNSLSFSYDPPYVSYISSNTPDAEGDVIEVHGANFGTSDDMSAPVVYFGDDENGYFVSECGPISLGTSLYASMIQVRNGEYYIWCSFDRMTVGSKSVFVSIGGQNVSYESSQKLILSECKDGYYGQDEWTAFTTSDSTCYRECSARSIECMLLYNPYYGNYSDASCESVEPCVQTKLVGTEELSNCTVLTKQDEYCVPCPSGSYCLESNGVYPQEPISEEGYWRLEERASDDVCEDERLHRHYCYDVVPCQPTNACEGDNTCSKGYTSTRCAECCDLANKYLTDDDGKYVKDSNGNKILNEECYNPTTGDRYEFYRLNGKCVPCPSSPLMLLLVFLSCGLFIAGAGYFLQKKKMNLAILSIGVDYFQVLSIFSQTDVPFPYSLRMLFTYLSVFNFNLNLTAPDCLFVVSYETKWYMIVFMPVFFFLVILGVHFSKVLYKYFFKGKRGKKLNSHLHQLIGTSIIIFYYLYLFMCNTILEVFNCNYPQSEDGTVEDSTQYMEASPETVCYENGSMQMRLVPVASLMFLLYALGYPLTCGYIVLRNRRACMEDQILRIQKTGTTRKTNPYYYEFRKRYARLYFHYKPEYYYWILLILLRKFSLVSVALLFRENPNFQLCMMLLVLFVAYAMHVRNAPYYSDAEKEKVLEKHKDIVKDYNLTVELEKRDVSKLREEEEESKGGKISALDMMRRASFQHSEMAKEKGKNLAVYLWNYNTVEAVLLGCAVLITLFGVMFLSEFLDKGSYSYNGLVIATFFFIIFSIAYYLVVLWTEVIAVLFPSLQCTCFGLVSPQTKEDEEVDSDDENLEDKLASQIEVMSQNPMFMADNPIMQDIGPKKPEYMSVEEQVELQKTVDKLLEENRKLKQEKQGLLSLGGRNPVRSTVQDPRRRKKKKKFDDGIEMEEIPASGLPGMKREGNDDDGGEEREGEGQNNEEARLMHFDVVRKGRLGGRGRGGRGNSHR